MLASIHRKPDTAPHTFQFETLLTDVADSNLRVSVIVERTDGGPIGPEHTPFIASVAHAAAGGDEDDFPDVAAVIANEPSLAG